MGVYIDMEMPKKGFVEILIRDDGTVQQTGQTLRIDGNDYYTFYVGEMPVMYKAVPVPAHGRLIDADALVDWLKLSYGTSNPIVRGLLFSSIIKEIQEYPSVIPAEQNEKEV